MKKKLLPLLALIVVATSFTSCKKDFKCVCTYTDIDGTKETVETTINSRRPSASLSCSAQELVYSVFQDVNCKLK